MEYTHDRLLQEALPDTITKYAGQWIREEIVSYNPYSGVCGTVLSLLSGLKTRSLRLNT